MIESGHNLPLLILLIGLAVVAGVLIQAGLSRTMIPPLVGYLCLGGLFKILDMRLGFMSESFSVVFEFLGKIGVVALLFEAGLESNLSGLLRQLRRASLCWIGDIVVSAVLVFATARFLLGFEFIPSLVTACALTATSVGVSVTVWRRKKALDTRQGSLLVDVAEMDDISVIVLMALLFILLPILKAGGDLRLGQIAATAGVFGLKFLALCLACYLFNRYLERGLSAFFQRISPMTSFALVVAAVGFVIAAIAGLMGFSLAIGAFFAGLVFSRDPKAVRIEGAFQPVYELFTPFFFIAIGMRIDPSAMGAAILPGLALFLTATLSKIIGAGGPIWAMENFGSFLLIGPSMVPRAEITMIVTEHAQALGDWAMPPEAYGAVVLVAAATCLAAPAAVNKLLNLHPPDKETS
jgi:Kef-type K+ transport system membrane component KefB